MNIFQNYFGIIRDQTTAAFAKVAKIGSETVGRLFTASAIVDGTAANGVKVAILKTGSTIKRLFTGSVIADGSAEDAAKVAPDTKGDPRLYTDALINPDSEIRIKPEEVYSIKSFETNILVGNSAYLTLNSPAGEPRRYVTGLVVNSNGRIKINAYWGNGTMPLVTQYYYFALNDGSGEPSVWNAVQSGIKVGRENDTEGFVIEMINVDVVPVEISASIHYFERDKA